MHSRNIYEMLPLCWHWDYQERQDFSDELVDSEKVECTTGVRHY
jgi:hypothetical protein